MDTRFIRLKEVMERTSLSRSTIYQMMSAGGFPSQIPIGRRAVGWLKREIDEWIETRINESRYSNVRGE